MLAKAPLRSEGSTEPPPEEEQVRVGDVSVPGNLQVQLGFEDPWLDTPELTTLNAFEWLYSRGLSTPRGAGRHVLVFDGIDYFCDVWVNGIHAAHHEGAFSEWEVDVTDLLNAPGEDNDLMLGISCPWRVDSRQFYLNPSTVFSVVLKNSEYMKGNLLHYWDGLPLSGNAVFPFGPWKDVWLETRSGTVLRRAAISTVAVGDGRAELELHCEWWSDEPDRDANLEIEVAPETFEGAPLTFTSTIRVERGPSETSTRFELGEPHLWWTWDTGPQDLYRATISGPDGARAETVFGIRTLRRDEETLAYYLNGTRLFLRGVWYPFANIFNASPTSVEHRRDVEMLRDGNSNHIVSFTFIEKAALYEACDRLGMLVLQELPYHQLGPMKVVDPAYPRFEEYRSWSLGEVENIVRQLRGHASVVLWGAFAETRKNERWVWGDYSDYSAAIEEIVRRADPDAVYHPSFCDFKEEHIWNGGFPFGEFWDHKDRNHHFISEFGAIAPPVVETLREFMPAEAIWRDGAATGRVGLPIDVEEYSYRWAFDYAGLTTSVARMFRHADRTAPTLERFVDAVQWYQAFGLRYCAEVYRQKRFADVAGCRTWSYRENVPGIKFTVVDHRQRPKLGYFGLKAGYEPILITIDEARPLAPLTCGDTYARDVWVINDTPRAAELMVELAVLDVGGRTAWSETRLLRVGGDAAAVEPLGLDLPQSPGPYLLRATARDADGTVVTTSDNWLRVVAPAFDPPIRVLLLGQSRYNEPIVEALADVGGVAVTVVDEMSRQPQDSSWSQQLAGHFDAVWFAGWDYAAHLFREQEWAAIAAAVESGVGFVHTGGQASFHGGDGRGALLDCTPLDPVLPVSLRPHDGIWDREPALDRGRARETLGVELAGLPFRGFSRTAARPGAEVHARLDDFPLLVTGQYGAGSTVVFTASFTKPLRMFRIGEGLDWEDPLDVAPHWARADIRAYGPYWPGIRQLAIGLLAAATGRSPTAPPTVLDDRIAQPIFELLAELPTTTLGCTIAELEFDDETETTQGRVVVTNTGDVVARLIRGRVLSDATRDHRLRDGFVDLMPGQEAVLRFEAACGTGEVEGVEINAQNVAPVVVPARP
jgi:beta-mannosidase